MSVRVAESNRLWLETLNWEEHFEAYHVLQSHPLAMLWSSRAAHTSPEQSLEQMKSMGPSPEEPWNQRWAIMLRPATAGDDVLPRENGLIEKLKPQMIGLIGIVRKDEIGYKIHPDFWGKGYMPEALALFVDFFWKSDTEAMKTCNRLIAAADAGNQRSLRVLEKAGFVKDRYEKEFYERGVDKGKGLTKRDLQFFYLDRPHSGSGASN